MPTNVTIVQSLTAIIVAFVAANLLIPAIIRGASRWKLLDVPRDARRVHRHPIPRLGGVGVVAATAIAIAAAHWMSALFSGPLHIDLRARAPLAGAIAIVFATGIVDDVRGVSPRWKLMAQAAAASLLLWAGFTIQPIALSSAGGGIPLGWLAPAIVLVWLVGMTNAFNLVDGVDGLAGTVALIAAAVCIGVEGLWMHRAPSIATLALIGAMLGFLRFNNSPAKIFLGDSGSMTVGFFLAAQSIVSAPPRLAAASL